MYVLVLVACATFSGVTHCQEFERDHRFSAQSNCQVAAAIEKGEYQSRAARRKDWLEYRWACNSTEPMTQVVEDKS